MARKVFVSSFTFAFKHCTGSLNSDKSKTKFYTHTERERKRERERERETLK